MPLKTRNNSGLVPPPPATPMPAFFPAPYMQAQTQPAVPIPDAGFQTPQIAPVQVQPVDPSFFNLPPSLVQQRQAQDARLNNLTTQANQPMQPFQYQEPAQDAFHQEMQGRIQQAILQNLGSGNGPGTRFQKGFDLAQQLAANTIVPLTAGSGPKAMGALAASNEINNQVRARESNRSQEKAATNQALANLSDIYGKMDLRSAQNVSSLLKSQLEIYKSQQDLNRQNFQQKLDTEKMNQDQVKAAESNYLTQRDKLASSRAKTTDQKIDAQGNQIRAADLGLNAQKSNRAAAESDRDFQLKQQDQNYGQQIARGQLGLGLQNLGLRGDELDQKINSDNVGNQINALKGLGTLLGQYGRNTTETLPNSNGSSKYPGIREALGNQGMNMLLQNLGAKAGVAVPNQPPPPPAAPPQKDFDWGQALMGAGQAAGNMIAPAAQHIFGLGGSGRQQQAPAPTPTPQTVDPKVLAQAGTDATARQQVVAQIRQQLMQAGENPTPERILQEIKSLQTPNKRKVAANGN